jgi:hypothetical protein
MKLNEEDDFGFSLVSEQELKAHEELLRQKVQEQTVVKDSLTTQYQNKIDGLMAMIMPLLTNLAKDPTKEYIFWPDRSVKINAFKKKIEDYVNT